MNLGGLNAEGSNYKFLTVSCRCAIRVLIIIGAMGVLEPAGTVSSIFIRIAKFSYPSRLTQTRLDIPSLKVVGVGSPPPPHITLIS